MKRWFAVTAVVFLAVAVAGRPARAADPITIATGTAGGLYYVAGEAICKTIAARTDRPPPPSSVAASRGSMANILALDPVKKPFAIVQSDIEYNAITGGGLFGTVGADRDLRSVFSLHGEAFTILVRADSGISSIDDLKTRKFSAGRIGTGTRETAEALFDVLGWTPADRKGLANIAVGDQSAALCAGEVDAIAYLIGHPSPIVSAATEACSAKLLPVPKAAVDGLASKLLYYRPATVSGGVYKGNEGPISTVGLRAVLVTRADVPDHVVRDVVTSVFGNLQIMRDASPAFAGFIPAEMSTQGLIAPLHPAALEFYRAQGLPVPSVEITPVTNSPITGKDGSLSSPLNLNTDQKQAKPDATTGNPKQVQKPAYNSVPVGPAGNWQFDSGTRGTKDPSLVGDGSLPDAEENLRLRLPMPK
jgi:TRAP transporter TAXI family solute receptor